MDYTNESIQIIKEIENVIFTRTGLSTERWLDVAFKLDYITFKEKELINSSIRKMKENDRNQKANSFCKSNYASIKRMKEIISNTVIPPEHVRSVTV